MLGRVRRTRFSCPAVLAPLRDPLRRPRSVMASILTRKSLEKRDSSDEKTPRSIDEEKTFDATTTVSEVAESSDGDEALRLVGRERTAQFSDEYNRKLRRKLVSRGHGFLECLKSPRRCGIEQDMIIPPLCAAVYFTQFL